MKDYADIKYNSSVSKHILLYIILTIIGLVNTIYIYKSAYQTNSHIIHYNSNSDNGISCHKKEPDSTIPVIDNETVTDNSLFFIETSCKGGLDSRQACAIESAARANPNKRINVLFAGPVSGLFKASSTLAILEELGNVKAFRLHVANYTKGTPIESLIAKNTVNKSPYQISHMSDVLRMVTLYKYGGIYLDLDVITVKSYDDLPKNWIAKETNENVAAGILAFENENIGKRFTEEALKDLNKSYKPKDWSHNGPAMVTRVLKKLCKTKDTRKMNAKTCQGIELFGPQQFYPVHWRNWKTFFDPPQGELNLTGIYTYHIYNKFAILAKVTDGSLYDLLAKTFCPGIYGLYLDDFGS